MNSCPEIFTTAGLGVPSLLRVSWGSLYAEGFLGVHLAGDALIKCPRGSSFLRGPPCGSKGWGSSSLGGPFLLRVSWGPSLLRGGPGGSSGGRCID